MLKGQFCAVKRLKSRVLFLPEVAQCTLCCAVPDMDVCPKLSNDSKPFNRVLGIVVETDLFVCSAVREMP